MILTKTLSKTTEVGWLGFPGACAAEQKNELIPAAHTALTTPSTWKVTDPELWRRNTLHEPSRSSALVGVPDTVCLHLDGVP